MTSATGAGGAGEAIQTASNTKEHAWGGDALASEPEGQAPFGPDPEVLKKLVSLRAHVRGSFGQIAMAMMMLPRYRHQTLGDLQQLVLEPLIRDRIAIAYPGNPAQDPLADSVGIAIWASVSEEADARIREQVKAGAFPVRLKPEDWTSGDTHWLLDVIAPDSRTTAQVIANFRQVVKDGSLRLHPIITRLVDAETLKKMGAVQRIQENDGEQDALNRPTSSQKDVSVNYHTN